MSFIAAGAAIVSAGVGVAKLFGASKRKKEAKEAQKKAKAELDAKKKQYEALDTSNLNKNMENKMEDLTINQKGMQLQTQQGQQQRANIMQQMQGAAGGSGIAALAQQMANQGQLAAQKAAATIGDQEAANQKAAAEEAANIQRQKIEGAEKARTLQYDKTSNLMNLAAGEAAAAGAAKDAARQEFSSGIGQIASSAIGLGS